MSGAHFWYTSRTDVSGAAGKVRPVPARFAASRLALCGQRLDQAAVFGILGRARNAHAVMPQQRVDLGFAAAERAERVDRGAAAAHCENFVAKALTRKLVERSIFLEQAVG